MRGGQCYLCKNGNPKHHTEKRLPEGKACQNCYSSILIREEQQKENKKYYGDNIN